LIDYYEINFIGLPFIFKKQIDEYNAISSKTTSDFILKLVFIFGCNSSDLSKKEVKVSKENIDYSVS